MKITLDLPDWIAAALLEWNIPEELAGSSIEDRLHYLAEGAADGIQSANRRVRLYRLLGLPHPDYGEDDDIPF